MHFSTGAIGAALLSLLVAQAAAAPLADDTRAGALEARAERPSAPVFPAVPCLTVECSEGRSKARLNYHRKLQEWRKNQDKEAKKPGLLEARAERPSAPVFPAVPCLTVECSEGRSKARTDYHKKLREWRKNQDKDAKKPRPA